MLDIDEKTYLYLKKNDIAQLVINK